jgi:hypothetical protein
VQLGRQYFLEQISSTRSASTVPSASPFSKILLGDRNGVGDVCETEHLAFGGVREGVKRSGLHLDGQDAFGPGGSNCLFRFPKWRVGGPARADMKCNAALLEPVHCGGDESRVDFAVVGRRRVVIARTQRAIDHYEIRKASGRHDLTRRCQIDEEATPAGEQLLCQEDGKGRADDAADDADAPVRQGEGIQIGVITGPGV